MHGDTATPQLSKLLETRFCDAEDADGHESLLKKYSEQFLKGFDLREKALLFSALSEENRLKILSLLTLREMCVCELTAALDMTQPNLTYHVKKLENVGLVKPDKQGKWVYYSLTEGDDLHQTLRECISSMSVPGGNDG
jgi:DNA-binding transcriptional ArsR family regulator